MSRLTIDITDQQHQRLKAMAALQGKSIKQYAVERLFPTQVDDEAAWQALKSLIGQRIEQGLAGTAPTKDFNAIVDEEMGRGDDA